MSGCVICGGEVPPRKPGHNGGGRPRTKCGKPECLRAYNRTASRKSYQRLRELNAAGIYAAWQVGESRKRQPKVKVKQVAVRREQRAPERRVERMDISDYAWGTM